MVTSRANDYVAHLASKRNPFFSGLSTFFDEFTYNSESCVNDDDVPRSAPELQKTSGGASGPRRAVDVYPF